MRANAVLQVILGLKKTKVVSVAVEGDGIIVDVKPIASVPYCSGCGRPVHQVHDDRSRFWRHLDLAGMHLRLRYPLQRVDCERCGTCVELVPWADPGSWFTNDFEEQVAYLAQTMNKSAIVDMMRVAWRTVGAIIARVVDRFRPGDPLDGLTHIGIDELAVRKNHEYITVVIDHVSKRVVWAAKGKDAATLSEFFTQLGPERCAKIEAVTLDMSGAYVKAVTDAGLADKMIFDRFHVEKLAHDALDEVRREQVRELKGTEEGKVLKRTRYILFKNLWNMTEIESKKLSKVQETNKPLYRGRMLLESLKEVLDNHDLDVGRVKLKEWVSWALRSNLEPFKKLAGTVKKHFEGILAYIPERLNNGRTEGMNRKIRSITARSYGFHCAHNLIALIFLCCSGITLLPVLKFAGVRK